MKTLQHIKVLCIALQRTMSGMRAAVSVLCTLAALYVFSCTDGLSAFFGGKIAVSVKIPKEYAQNTAGSGTGESIDTAYMLYFDSAMQTQAVQLEADRQSITVILPKNRVTPFLFYLNASDGKPQGCIYPFGTQANTAGGFTAFVLYRISVLAEQPAQDIYTHISRFNWQKLYELICAYDDPWILDDGLIAEKIAEGTFSARHIRKK